MKVDVNAITEEGIIKQEDIQASRWDLDTPDIKFVKDIHLWCEFRKIRNEILVKVQVSSDRKARCSRCLETSTYQANQEFYLSYNKKTIGQFLEVDSQIREEILLDWPMKPLCKDDCKGICPGCGKNLNFEQCQCKEKTQGHKDTMTQRHTLSRQSSVVSRAKKTDDRRRTTED
jgi:uncharacterized protein